jgi:hypothetical protein
MNTYPLTITRNDTALVRRKSGLFELVPANRPSQTYDVNGDYKYFRIPATLTNKLTAPRDLTNVAWVKTRTTVSANAIASPTGVVDADKLIPNTQNDQHFVAQSVSVTNGIAETFPFWLKKGEYDRVQVQRTDTNFDAFFIVFNADTGTITSQTGTFVRASMVATGNGWYYCQLTVTPVATASVAIRVTILDASGSAVFAGNETDGIYLWGLNQYAVNAEVSPFDYLDTAATRQLTDARNTAMPELGRLNFILPVNIQANSTQETLWVYGDDNDNNITVRKTSTNTIQLRYTRSGSLVWSLETSAFTSGDNTITVDVTDGSTSLQLNSTTPVTGSGVWNPSGFDTMVFGRNISGTSDPATNVSFQPFKML